jgi:hypothetical protein
LLVVLIAAGVAGPASAQFVNRAVWLGFDEEGVRPEFRQGREYYLDRLSYVVPPPWADLELRWFDDGARYAFGSVSAREFTFEGRIDHHVPLGDGVAFHYHVLQSEHRDARFDTTAIGLELQLDAERTLFVQGTPFADKSQIDVSVGAFWWRRPHAALRTMLTLVDAPADKSEVVDYERAPYGLHAAGAFGSPERLRVAFELGTQLPMRAVRLADGARFDLQRTIGIGELRAPLGERDRLLLAAEAESTDKRLRPAAAGDPLREHFDREFHQLRLEWWRDTARPWSIGVVHTRLDEHGRRPNDPDRDLRTKRREWFGVLRRRYPIDERLFFEPQLFAGQVGYEFRDGVLLRDQARFEGKAAWNVGWEFSPRASLVLVVSTQLDELAFGGGGAQFVAWF